MTQLAQITQRRMAEWLVNNDPGFRPETSIRDFPNPKHVYHPLDGRVTLKGLFVRGRTFRVFMDLYANI
jgi:hypothetical protein